MSNLAGMAVIVGSLVFGDEDKPHPYKLVGRNCQNGIIKRIVEPDHPTARFESMGIQCVKRGELEESLRMRKSLHVDPFNNIDEVLRENLQGLECNVLRICFQAYLENPNKPGAFDFALPPVVSGKIYNAKDTSLKILKMNRNYGLATGYEELFIFCDKVDKDDIKVEFYEESGHGTILWRAYGVFDPEDVHHQVAIVLRTPLYKNTNIHSDILVKVSLMRPSDEARSKPMHFIYIPKGDIDGLHVNVAYSKNQIGRLVRKTHVQPIERPASVICPIQPLDLTVAGNRGNADISTRGVDECPVTRIHHPLGRPADLDETVSRMGQMDGTVPSGHQGRVDTETMGRHSHQLMSDGVRSSNCGGSLDDRIGATQVDETPLGVPNDGGRYYCGYCGKVFTQSSKRELHRRLHRRIDARDRELPQFVYCERALAKVGGSRSPEKIHEGEGPHQCKYCIRTFEHLDTLSSHEKIHTSEKTYCPCNHCGQTFTTSRGLTVHKRKHTGGRPFWCTHCDDTFDTSDDLKQHLEKRHQCQYCEETFKKKTDLSSHEKMHRAKSRGSRPFQCSHCGKSFRFAHNMRYHEIIHTEKKSYLCSYCGRTFRYWTTFRAHEITHTRSYQTL